MPETRVRDFQFHFNHRIARREFTCDVVADELFARRGGGDGEMQTSGNGLLAAVAHIRPDKDLAGLGVRLNVEILDPSRRTDEQLDRIDQAAALVFVAGKRRACASPLGNVHAGHAVDRLVARAQHADGDPVGRARFGGFGHVERKRFLSAFVPADVNAVHPNVGQIVGLPEPQ